MGVMRRGQTMLEYVLVLLALMGAAAASGLLIRAMDAQAERSKILLGSEFP